MTEPITKPIEVEHHHHSRVDFVTFEDKRLTLNLRSIESINFRPGQYREGDPLGPYEAVMRSGERWWLNDANLGEISSVNAGWARVIRGLRRVPS